MKFTEAENGFPMYEFVDTYNRYCSVELSTLADDRCIWIGREQHRMHLNVNDVKALLPVLQRFVINGDIHPESKPPQNDWRNFQ